MSILEKVQPIETMLPERYYTMSTEDMEKRVREIKEKMGGNTIYSRPSLPKKMKWYNFLMQQEIHFSLRKLQRAIKKAKYIVFCGVHFMAETADMLTTDDQIVILPDMRAGCSMADMADIEQTERAWKELTKLFGDTMIPLTYVNSTAAIKAFCGRNGGATVTSSNAKQMVSWAFTQKERLVFLPDQHLGRNTTYDLGIPLDKMAVWDPYTDSLEYEEI